ncbi:MAG TPA: hypothetical protein VIY51_23255 [Xanthobacteraceae bacterium]
MSIDWSAWSPTVTVWWAFMLAVSAANIAAFLLLVRRLRARTRDGAAGWVLLEPWVLLCAAYVFGCAFRAALPRADVQRICLFDTWLSTVVVGRSVATVAEICFALQWAIVLRQIAVLTRSDTVHNISKAIVPLILVAECCSWYAVITTDFLANALENSLWAVAFLLVAVALLRLLYEFHGVVRLAMATALIGLAGYVAFMAMVDVPMYLARWQADAASGKAFLGVLAGLYDVSTRLVVTHDLAAWGDEIAWMSLYFSVAVWSSLALCGFHLVKERLPHYRTRAPGAKGAAQPLPVRVPARPTFQALARPKR